MQQVELLLRIISFCINVDRTYGRRYDYWSVNDKEQINKTDINMQISRRR